MFNITVANLMTCQGFPNATDILGGCSMAWIGFAIILFLNLIARKWLGEEAGMEYNLWIGYVGGFLVYVALISILVPFKWSLVAGLIGMLIGGYAMGMIMPSGDENYGE